MAQVHVYVNYLCRFRLLSRKEHALIFSKVLFSSVSKNINQKPIDYCIDLVR